VHGAKYFRRWHAQMENSGGLLVHKATHHFDLVNWLLSGYIRDRCLFREEIDIYDTRNAIVRNRGGAQLSYALNASPIRPLRGIASR